MPHLYGPSEALPKFDRLASAPTYTPNTAPEAFVVNDGSNSSLYGQVELVSPRYVGMPQPVPLSVEVEKAMCETDWLTAMSQIDWEVLTITWYDMPMVPYESAIRLGA